VPNLRDFERRLGGLVEGLFSKTFRSGVQPVELAKRLIKEMDAGRTVGVKGTWAPNRFEFYLSKEDAERFEQAEAALAAELQNIAKENADERRYGLVGPPEVEFFMDVELKKGDFGCVGSLVEGEQPAAPVAGSATTRTAARAGSLTIHEQGTERTVVLDHDVVTIGRLPECDVVVKDKGASRRHAQIKIKDGRATITDLGSTNGTRLNGGTIQSRELSDGDRITIGTTVLEYRGG
jgi:FhaA, N-terminal domain/FHA domain